MRNLFRRFSVLFFALLVCGVRGAAAQDAQSLEEAFVHVAETVGPSVVSINTVHTEKVGVRRHRFGAPYGGRSPEDEFFDEFFRDFFGEMPERDYQRRGLGSGVIIDANGYILTNEHVVEDADEMTVILSNGKKFKGTVTGTDPRLDLAVIKIDAKNLPAARLGNSDDVRIGQWAIAIGNPFGYIVNNPKPTVTVGVISAVDRALPKTTRRDRDYSDLIQTDAAINPGNSGGPLVNLKGEVVGINVAIFSTSGGSEGVGFAIPANAARRVVSQLIEGKKVLYGWLGVNVQDIDEDLQQYFSLPDRNGVLVAGVVKGGPADKRGMREGDVVRTLGNLPVENARELMRKVGQTPIGTKIKMGILREQKDISVEVTIEERPEDFTGLDLLGKVPLQESWRGIRVQEMNMSPAFRKPFGQGPAHGVVIQKVEPGSPAERGGLREGDVINQVNRIPIPDLAGYQKAIQEIHGDCLVRTHRGFAVVREK